jgi:integrase
MALQITQSCVNCWACVDVCPNDAIYQDTPHFLIDDGKCTECLGDHSVPQCAAICPIEMAIVNELGEFLNPPGSHIYLSIEQVRTLADAASEQTRAAIWIALLTGCRRGEILKLRREHIGRDSLHIPAGNTKTLRVRTVPIVPALRPWLEFVPLKINAEGLKSGFRRAREAVGMAVTFHDLRHSCASLLINYGVPLEVIRDILGHTTVKTTERYAHLQIDRQAAALGLLSNAIDGKKAA